MSLIVQVPIVNDTVNEPSETFNGRLILLSTDATDVRVATPLVQIVINDSKIIILMNIHSCDLTIIFLSLCTVADCGPLEDPSDGRVMFNSTKFNHSATYTCNDGFELEGNRTRTCQANGEWSGSNSTCEGILYYDTIPVCNSSYRE